MIFPRRLFVLLGAYEDLTERERHALRRGDIDHAITLENRKVRLAEAMAQARRSTELSGAEIDDLNRRVRNLEARNHENLAFLREEMMRVGAALSHLHKAVHRARQVRRGYLGAPAAGNAMAESVLGRA